MTTATAPEHPAPPVDPFTPGARLTATAGDLIDALTAVGTSVPTRPPVPVLGSVILDVTDGQATLSGFDFDTSTTVQVDGIAHNGRALLSHAELSKVLKAAVKGETRKTFGTWPVTIDVEQRGTDDTRDRQATATVGGFTVPVTCMPLADYPTLPKRQTDDTISVERATLVAMLGRVATAVSGDETLQVLTCVHAELSGGALTLATTDRHRLAVTTVHGVADTADTGAWLLPCTTLAQIVKALPDGPVTVSVDPTTPDQVTVRGGHIVSTVRLINAEFPRFHQLMPDTFTTSTVVNRTALHKAALKAHALCRALDTRMDVITVTVSTDGVAVAPRVNERADAVHGQRIDANGSGTPMMFGVNAVYLAEALASFTGDTVALGLNDPNKPIMIADDVVSLGTSNTAHRHLVMPIRLPAQG